MIKLKIKSASIGGQINLLLFILWLAVFSLTFFSIVELDPGFRDQPFTLLDPLRNHFGQVIDTILPFPQSAVLIGMLLGMELRFHFY